jgi:hypothetical protein
MERTELVNPREVVKKLFQQHVETSDGSVFDPMSYFEKNVSWDEVS